MSGRVQLSDIAEKLGLNKSTVSRALRNDPRISQETAKRVHALAEELGYQRDPTLATLSEIRWRKTDKRSLMNWGFLITELAAAHPENQIFRDHVIHFAKQAGYTISQILLKPDTTTAQVCRIIRERRLRGIIINQVYNQELVSQIDFREVSAAAEACVYCGSFFFEPDGHYIVENVHQATISALNKIRERGHHRIAVLYNVALKDSREVLRQRAAALLFQQQHADMDIQLCEVSDENTVAGYTGADALLTSHRVWLHKLGKEFQGVPHAVLRVAPGATHLSGNIRPYEDLAASAVDMVDFQLRRSTFGIESRTHTILVDSKWQEGQSL